MNLLISIPAALLGSIVGSAARGGATAAQARLVGEPEADGDVSAADAINITISPAAALVGGLAGAILGPRSAFWIGAVLGAAGLDRVDAMLMSKVGIDVDAMVARATEAATSRTRPAEPVEAA